jgi:hypothetical protein
MNDINKIITLYTTNNYSTHKLGEMFKMGHKKISQILKENNIVIRKKGGQVKIGNSKEIEIGKTIRYDSSEYDLIAVCKKTGEIINDPNNLSGKLTKHIISLYGDINIPKNNYQRKKYENKNGKKWFEEFFDIVKREKEKKRKCGLCEWSTTDLENKTGCFERHILNFHNIKISDYLDKFKDEKKLHKSYLEKEKKEIEFISKKNFIKCEICGEKMKTITNTHLMNKHNISVEEYKLKYPNSKIVCDRVSEIYTKNIKEINLNQSPTWTSKGENEIKEFIENLGLKTEKGKNRKLLEGKEIDILIPEKKIGIEYNGLYFHTEKMGKNSSYHLNKTLESNINGYKLIQVFEDEWMTNKDLVKEKLKHILGFNNGIKIGARETKIIKINKEQKSIFLKINHIQGNDKSNIFYGAFYKDILIGVMTFNSKRNMTKNNDDEYELSRFSVKSGYVVSGMASKFLKYFINEYKPNSIISFADRRWTIDGNKNLYISLGFELNSILKPSYYYYNSSVSRYKRFHKFSFGKNNLKKRHPDLDFTKSENELTKELGYEKIWDCGLFKYKLIIK